MNTGTDPIGDDVSRIGSRRSRRGDNDDKEERDRKIHMGLTDE
jgi:hypothetical protein